MLLVNGLALGTATLLWDGTINLGTATIDGTGSLTLPLVVPTTSAGEHTFTVNDGVSNFCVNITRLPTVANDYDRFMACNRLDD